ncbi:MAG: site-2 protease family protein [Nitrososphaerota archaeon]|nr:site-2 protease family protein [Nitrososphaerota archaeon]MDG7013718.1 site-2 protease family protein [Nitrososphaerota archaeon]
MGQENFKRFELHYGVVLMLRTRRFLTAMDWMGRSRIAKPMSWLLLYLMPVSAGVAFFIFISVFRGLISSRGPQIAQGIVSLGPLVNLGIPGLNPYIPILYGWIALVIGMIVHEGAHGVIARSLGIPVKNSGLILLFFVIPIGAFVDIEESAIKQAPKRHSARVLAAGAGTNLVLAVLCLLLLVGVVSTMSPVVNGAAITAVGQGTPAYAQGVHPGDIVTAVDGKPITNLDAILGPSTNLTAGQTINFTVYRHGQTIEIDNIKLVCCMKIIDTRTNQTLASYPYIGVDSVSEANLRSAVSSYTNVLGDPLLYIGCIPTLEIGNCQQAVPFSNSDSVFYVSPLGSALVPIANVLYWLFFLNFNLAIFNSLPIFPLDGGQAFGVGVEALGRGRLSEAGTMRITMGATMAMLIFLLAIIAGPYFYVYLFG